MTPESIDTRFNTVLCKAVLERTPQYYYRRKRLQPQNVNYQLGTCESEIIFMLLIMLTLLLLLSSPTIYGWKCL